MQFEHYFSVSALLGFGVCVCVCVCAHAQAGDIDSSSQWRNKYRNERNSGQTSVVTVSTWEQVACFSLPSA